LHHGRPKATQEQFLFGGRENTTQHGKALRMEVLEKSIVGFIEDEGWR
jgi:hypothetical protein